MKTKAAAILVGSIFLLSILFLSGNVEKNVFGEKEKTATIKNPQFVAELLPVNPFSNGSQAHGEAFFKLGDNDEMNYVVNAYNIANVSGVMISLFEGAPPKDGITLRSATTEGLSGPVDGTLVAGNFTSQDFREDLRGYSMLDLVKSFLDGNIVVRINTPSSPLAEIYGYIEPNTD